MISINQSVLKNTYKVLIFSTRRQTVLANDIGGFRDIYIWGGKLFRGPEGRERRWGQLGVWGSAVSSPSGI